jgi:hypothetical protein
MKKYKDIAEILGRDFLPKKKNKKHKATVMPKHPFCTSCNKIVPESEALDPFDTGKLIHHYYKTENAYGNLMSEAIGYCPVQHPVYCGEIREPTDQEYFIYETLKTDAKSRTKR